MTGRDRILKAIRCEPVDRVPWLPFVGCHGGHLIGKSPTEYLQSVELMVQGARAAATRYRPDGLPVAFDLQIEAEALGCDLLWSDQNPPAVTSHPLQGGVSLDELDLPNLDEGRIPIALEATRRMRQDHPDLALYGLVTGPLTLALHLAGIDLFLQMFQDSNRVHELLEFCRQVTALLSNAYIEAGVDVVAIVDPMTSQIGPDQFAEFVSGPARALFDDIRSAGTLSSFFVCGQAEHNITVMCDCGPDNLSVDENIPLDTIRDICLPREISFGGNLKLTSSLLLGTELESQQDALRCLEIAGERGFILAPGCDLPYATPPENLEAVAELVHDPYQRQVVSQLQAAEAQDGVIDLVDYDSDPRVSIDIITLDSEACAPCQYMVEAVRNIAPEFGDRLVWREHKIKHRESIALMRALKVRAIPSICIDGVPTFASRIPPRDRLVAAIQEVLDSKPSR